MEVDKAFVQHVDEDDVLGRMIAMDGEGDDKAGGEVVGGNVGSAVVDKGFVRHVDEDDVLGKMIAVDGEGNDKAGSEVIGSNVGRAVVDKGFVRHVDEDDVLGRMIAVDDEGDDKAGLTHAVGRRLKYWRQAHCRTRRPWLELECE